MIKRLPSPIRFKHNLADHLEVQPTLYWESNRGRTNLVCGVLLLFFTLYSIAAYEWGWIQFVLLLEVAYVLFNGRDIRKWQLSLKEQWHRKTDEELEVSFSLCSIRFQSTIRDEEYPWENYERVVETSRYFLLLNGFRRFVKPRYTLIPKHAFSSDEEMGKFRTLLMHTINR
jgi:hypothetical protein